MDTLTIKTMSAGKGDQLRKGANLSKYREGYERIFSKKEAKKLMDDRMRPTLDAKKKQGKQGDGA